MRRRSTTIQDSADIIDQTPFGCVPNTPNTSTNDKPATLILPHVYDIIETSPLEEICDGKKYEKWVECEYTETLKALEKAYMENDEPKAALLKKALVDLEKSSSVCTSTSDNNLKSDYVLSDGDYEHGSSNIDKLILQNIKQYDYLLNLILVGERMTGKTSFIHTFVDKLTIRNPRKTSGYIC
jgi:hypothetical protein